MVSRHFGPRTLRTQDTSAPVSETTTTKHIGTSAEVLRTQKCLTDTSAPERLFGIGNAGSSHGKEDGCACIIT